MDRSGIIGLSLHDCDVASLEALRRPVAEEESLFTRELADALGASELVYLSTCNRVEVIYARESGHLPAREDIGPLLQFLVPEAADEVRRVVRFYSGFDAARHLFRVASSLDSLVIGEDQILAQVRSAYGKADAAGLTGEILRPLFDHTFQVAKHVRTATDLSRIPVSVVSLAIAKLLEERGGRPCRVAVVGAGRMGALLARAAAEAGFVPSVVANRTPDRARELAAPIGARAITLDELRAGKEPLDAILSATMSPGHVLSEEDLVRLAENTPSGEPLFAMDLAVPRDFAPTVDERVHLVDLESLREAADRNRAARANAAGRAESMIEEKIASFARHQSTREVNGVLSEVHDTASEMLDSALQDLLRGPLANMGADERAAVERWARSTFGRTNHLAMSAIKRLGESKPGSVTT